MLAGKAGSYSWTEWVRILLHIWPFAKVFATKQRLLIFAFPLGQSRNSEPKLILASRGEVWGKGGRCALGCQGSPARADQLTDRAMWCSCAVWTQTGDLHRCSGEAGEAEQSPLSVLNITLLQDPPAPCANWWWKPMCPLIVSET